MYVSGQLYAPAALPQGKYPGTHWLECRVGPSAGVAVLEKRKLFYPYRDSNTGLSIP